MATTARAGRVVSDRIVSIATVAPGAWYSDVGREDAITAAKRSGDLEARWEHAPVAAWVVVETSDVLDDEPETVQVLAAFVPANPIDDVTDRSTCHPATRLDCLDPTGRCRGHVEAIPQAVKRPRLVAESA
jgi:hypothetical protein